MNTAKDTKSSLDDWLDLIRRQEMPIFDQTARRVIALSGDDMAPMSELAGVILQDVSMTARALKLANSIVYNPSTTAINTITRAVIVLGFNAVRNICITLTLVDTLVKGKAKEHLARELGRAMHAAVQARSLAAARGDKSPEEVFIATLLYRIGELAFWCFGGEQAERIEQLVARNGITQEQAQERVLGFRLTQLTRELVREWRLTELLHEATYHPARQDPRIQSIMLGQRIARCAEEQGWCSDAMSALIDKAATLTALPADKTRALLFQKARAAATAAKDFGASFAAPYIPQPGSAEEDRPEQEPESIAAVQEQTRAPGRDAKLQADILRELEAVLKGGGCSFNVIMELVLEGIFKGVGVDRVIFALTTPDKGAIKAKYALGADQGDLVERFAFKRPRRDHSILFQTLDHKRPYLVDPGAGRAVDQLIPEPLADLSESAPFMVAPIVVDNQSIGLFYADRALTKRTLDRGTFDDFKHFVHQASIGVTVAAARRRQ